jgi:hypothetical protein
VASEETIIAAGKTWPTVQGDSCLQVGAIVGGLSTIFDCCLDRMTQARRDRWVAYANQAVTNIWSTRLDSNGNAVAEWNGKSFSWLGWGRGNPGP